MDGVFENDIHLIWQYVHVFLMVLKNLRFWKRPGVFEKDRSFKQGQGFEKPGVLIKDRGFEKDRSFKQGQGFLKKTGVFENGRAFENGRVFWKWHHLIWHHFLKINFTGEFPKNTQQELNKINKF